MSDDWTKNLDRPAVMHEPERPSDRQVGGNHYKDCPVQPAHYSEANGLSFLEGCVVKRVTRWRRGGAGVKDLRKAIHELELLIEEQEPGNDHQD